MRSTFSELLDKQMEQKHFRLLSGDVGYGILDKAWRHGRAYNMGASEQAMIGAAVGMTYMGLIPICYTITPFLLCRPFEWIRNYLDHEKAPVKLVGVGRDDDYKKLGFSHWAFDHERIVGMFKNIRVFCPNSVQELKDSWGDFIAGGPAYLSLKRD